MLVVRLVRRLVLLLQAEIKAAGSSARTTTTAGIVGCARAHHRTRFHAGMMRKEGKKKGEKGGTKGRTKEW
jgi:hypothetical protein